MAQRVSGFSKRPSGGGRAAERARSATEPEGEPIPLDLAAVIAPYRRHRGLSIRIERLAHGARLSQGRNNGDRSWSLAPDELDGLEYLPANENYEAHTLAVRIISLEGGDGETLAVIDLPIAGKDPSRSDTPETASGALSAEMQRLRDELVKVKSSLAARETELATARRSADALERSRQSLKSEFSAAEAAWDHELREQLAAAAADASANLEKTRAEWESENQRRAKSDGSAQKSLEEMRKRGQQDAQAALAKAQAEWKLAETARLASEQAKWRDESSKTLAELRVRAEQAEAALARARATASAKPDSAELDGLREELSSAHARLAARDAELAETRAAAEFARMRSQDSAGDLKKAEQAWRAAEAIRLAGVEARWKEQSTKAVAEVNSRLEQAEAALAEAQATAEVARGKSQDSATGLKKSEQAWKAAEAARFAAAEARWKEQNASALAEVGTKLEQADTALAEARAQAETRLHQLNALQSSLTAREAELRQLRLTAEETQAQAANDAEQSRTRWQKEIAAAVAKAQENFKAGESARLAAAEAQWKTQFATTLADATSKVQYAEAALAGANVEIQALRTQSGDERSRLQDDLATVQAELAALESELADARIFTEQARATADQSLQNVAAEIEKARKHWKKEADAALHKAEQTWRAEEAPRLAAAEAKWREQVALTVGEAQVRCESAEAGFADARACSEALRHELAAAQASLAHREIELAEARATLEQERERLRHVPIEAVERRPAWQEDQEEKQAQFRRRLIRDFAVVASVAGLAFMVFPHIQPVVAEAWPQDLSLKSDLKPLLQMAGLYKGPVVAPAPQEKLHATVEVRVANLRAQPSTSAAVLTKLTRDAEVVPVERRGKWVFVRIGEGPAQKQGWIARSVLKDDAGNLPGPAE
ncbi:MAG TPA: SH3 domain-containing protein [Rhizomicrobium sp.]